MYTFLICLSLLLYLLTTGLMVKGLFKEHGINMTKVRMLAIAAIISHLVLVITEIYTPSGQDLSLINIASLVCLIIVGATTVATIRFPAPFLLTVVYGFAAFVQFSTLFFPHPLMVKSVLSNMPLIIHIILSLLAYCALIIASLYAVQTQYISYRLKRKSALSLSANLPPLMQVERHQFQLLMIGTILLSLALVTGFIYLDDMFSRSVAHKTVLSLMAWGIYVALVLGHRFYGWRGKSSVISTLIGAFLLTLAYFGSRFVKEIILGRI